MLYGGYDHSIDKKGRLAIPFKMRVELGESFMICRSVFGKHCLCVYSMKEWEKLVGRIAKFPMAKASDIRRYLYEGSFNVEFDSQGRILIPASLREFANLNSEAHIIGMDSNIEIWNKGDWAQENDKYTPEAIASMFFELEDNYGV